MKFYSFDLDLEPMTLVLKLDLDIIKIFMCTKMKFLPSAAQNLASEQTDRHTHTDLTKINTYPHIRMVKT